MSFVKIAFIVALTGDGKNQTTEMVFIMELICPNKIEGVCRRQRW